MSTSKLSFKRSMVYIIIYECALLCILVHFSALFKKSSNHLMPWNEYYVSVSNCIPFQHRCLPIS